MKHALRCFRVAVRRQAALACLLGAASAVSAEPWRPGAWPTLRHYDGDHLLRIGLPLGGIGTGTVALGGRGELRDWEIMNAPARGFSGIGKAPGNDAPFFAIFMQDAGGHSQTRALLGPLDSSEYEAADGRPVNHHGLPRFRQAAFDAAYPFGQVGLSDPDLPVSVRLRAFNPLVPGDAEASGLPVAVLSYEVTNLTHAELAVAVCGSLRNFIGMDRLAAKPDWAGKFLRVGARRNVNEYRDAGGVRGIFFRSEGVDPTAAGWGTLALVTETADGVSHRTACGSKTWNRAMQEWWDDFSADGILSEGGAATEDDPLASLAVKQTIPAGATRTFTFVLAWHFPNRRAWAPNRPEPGAAIVGNYYCTRFADAWDVAARTVPRLAGLEAETGRFVQAVVGSDYPDDLKEAALCNLATLRSPTVFRLATGELMAWEGVMEDAGSCFGSCTHVWNYEAATAHLFGDLARTMRDVEFGAATAEDGRMSYRVTLPLSEPRGWDETAADGQMGTIVKFYREWQLSGDRAFLTRHWPKVRAALAYAWVPGGWDADGDGVMEGAQHNTMDVDYFGPNPQMQFWYLAALQAGARLAAAAGDAAFAARCEALRARGSAWTEQHLFNGEYYEQIITDPSTHAFVDWERPGAPPVPDFQLGRGCLVDQLVGQTVARLSGLGDVALPDHARRALASIMRYNFRASFAGHFNNMRSFVLGDEAGLVMAAWPRGRLRTPFPYFNEAMTGFEYTAAAGLIQAGMDQEALKVIHAVRSRFDGRKRNPFDEPECGFHYGRALASWNTLLAWSGFGYSAVDRTMQFAARPGTYFWSNGSAWGTVDLRPADLRMSVLHGRLGATRVVVGPREARLPGDAIPEGATLVLPLLPRAP
jgi:uncharacterized protein (DUF608 family)